MEIYPIPRLLLQNGIPLILSLLFSSLFNVVDSIFISRVSESALTALSIAAPVQALMSAVGCGIAVGLNAVISKALGEKDTGRVTEAASASMVLAIGAWLLIAAVCAAIVKPYCAWQAGGNGQIAAYAQGYLQVCMFFHSAKWASGYLTGF